MAASSQAFEMVGQYQDIFGKDNFFLELQQHDIPEIKKLNEWLVQHRGKANVPLVATNDVHYVLNEDFNAHDTLLCIQTSALKKTERRMRMSDASYHLRTPDEMWDLFGEVAPEALSNTLRIAEMCDLNLDSKGYHLPTFPVPEGYTADSYLRALALRGSQWRYGADADTERIRERIDYELRIIREMGFDTYFLIVWDLCEFARKADIWWNVRGSGAGSVVAYSLGITSIDPIRNNLIFERFLNPGRVSMPDIDMDFPDDRRSEMIDYAKRKYGEDKVAAIITFGTLKARAAIKDVGRVLDIPLAEVNALTKLVPNIPSHPVTLAQCLSDDPEYAVPDLKKIYAENPTIHNLLDTAITVEGVARSAGTHAAGIIIGDVPLVEYLPLHRPTAHNEDSVPIGRVTQFPMEICESIGLLKVDFLGLSTLTIMRKACDLIERYHNVTYTLANIPYRPDPNDAEVTRQVKDAFDLIGSGEVTGVFQLESQGMRKMLVEMRPQTFEHIIAAISLYRPGPLQFIPTFNRRLHGEEPVDYLHPKLVPVLSETFGICVYQEQIQQIAAQLFGYSLGDADLMRRAVSKKKAKDLIKHKAIFIEKGPENDVPADVAEKIFDQVEYFAAYGFNKCLVADTEIIDAATGRLIRIGDLAAGQAALTQTLTCDTDRLAVQVGDVKAVHSNGIKPVYRLTTQLGRQIDATANHPFYTFDGWRTLEELTNGSQIAVPRRLAIEGRKEWPDYQVIVLGHLLAEGNLCHPYGMYYYTNSETQWCDYVANLEQFDNVAASTHRRRGTMHDVYSRKIDPKRPNSVVEWIEWLGLRHANSYTKFIPAEVFELTNRQIGLLIARMWEGDGSISEKGRFAYYATSSERMGRQLQHLLLRFGIISRLRSVTFKYRGGEKYGYQLHIVGNENLKQFRQVIAVHFIDAERRAMLDRMIWTTLTSNGTKDVVPLGVRQLVRQHKTDRELTWDAVGVGAGISMTEFERPGHTSKGGFTSATIGRLAEFFDADDLRRYVDNDIYWDKVVSIEYLGEQMTYDLTIPGTHNFIANDILVHNSHAADYAVITCQTAFLKAHYPAEYYTALLTVQRDKIEDVTLFTADCRRLKIPILPPSLNHSELDFTIEETEAGRGIRFGLGAIKNAGDKAAQAIATERIAHGPYQNLVDFCERVDLRSIGRRALESLIKVGVFDEFAKRDPMLAIIDRMVKYSADQYHAKEVGQISIFGDTNTDTDDSFFRNLSNVAETPQRDMLRWEKELIGLYVSNHPLNALMEDIQRLPNINYSGQLKEDAETMHDKGITLVGLVVGIRSLVTKKAEAMAIVTFEDVQGILECVFFPRTWARFRDMIAEDQVYMIKGHADSKRGGDPQVIVDMVTQDWEISSSADQDQYADQYDDSARTYYNRSSGTDQEPPDVPRTAHEQTPPDEETLYEPIRRVSQNSNTGTNNTNANGSNKGRGEVSYAAARQETVPTREYIEPFDDEPAPQVWHIYVMFPAANSTDRAIWLRRMTRIYRDLIQCPGDDMLTFRFPEEGRMLSMDFPNRVSYERILPILEHEFRDTPDCWHIEPLSGNGSG